MVRVSGLTDSVVSVEVEFRHIFKRGALVANIAISVLWRLSMLKQRCLTSHAAGNLKVARE